MIEITTATIIIAAIISFIPFFCKVPEEISVPGSPVCTAAPPCPFPDVSLIRSLFPLTVSSVTGVTGAGVIITPS